ncbi:MAG: LicD family protein [Clostridia bacterium]|nr:LicD family protein [Clostridia bacterium]
MHFKHQAALLTLLREFDRVCRRLNISYTLFSGTMLGAVRHKGFIPWDDDIDVLMLRDDYERFLTQAHTVLDEQTFFLQKEFSEHWPMFFSKLRLNNTACLETYYPKDPLTHQGVYMDIFPCDYARSSEIGRKIQFLASKVVIAKSLWKRGYLTTNKKKKVFMGLCRILPKKLFLSIACGGSDKSEYVHTFFGGASSYSKNVYPREYFATTVMLPFEDGEFSVSSHSQELLKILYGDYMQLPPPEERRIKQHAVLVDLEHSYEIYREYQNNLTFEVLTRSIR